MQKIIPCLWFNGNAEEAVLFYTSLLPNSRIDNTFRPPLLPLGEVEGPVHSIQFTLAGTPYVALNGGVDIPHTEAISFQIHCDDQDEVDQVWSALKENGGTEIQCGWIQDRFGFTWQIIPRRLTQLIADPDTARAQRAMQAMLAMVKLDIEELERAAIGS